MLSQIFPVADPGRHTVTVKFDLPQGVPGGPGMYAEVKIPANAVDDSGAAILSVSERAIVRRGSLPYVFVMTGDGSVKLRMVRLGRQMGDRFIVLSGVEAGEQVMLDPPAGISSGRVPSAKTDPAVAQN